MNTTKYYERVALMLLLVISIIVLDFTDIIYNRYKVLPLLIFAFTTLPINFFALLKIRALPRSTIPYLVFLCLSIYGLIFNIYTKQISGLNSQIISTIMIGLAFPFLKDAIQLSRIKLGLYINSLLMCILAIYFNAFTSINYMTHERIFLAVFIYTIPAFDGKKILSLLGIMTFALVVYLDPRTTSLIALMLTLILQQILMRSTGKRLFRYIFPILVFTISILNLIINYIKELNLLFKTAAGGIDNSQFRENMISIGLSHFKNSPVFGSLFTQGGAYALDFTVILSNGQIAQLLPLHNDYLEVLVSGGIVGLSAFLVCIFLPIVFNFNYRPFLETEDRSLSDSLLVSCTVGLVVILFNPVMNSSRSGFILTVIFSFLFLIRPKSIRDS